MAKYQFPDLSGFEILYKGRRYIAFSINESHPFNDMEDFANFVVWDGYHNGAVSHGVINQDGTCTGELYASGQDRLATSIIFRPSFVNWNSGLS